MTAETLFLCHRLPFPPNKGDKIRSFALLKHLASLGPVHVGCFVDEKNDLKYMDKVRALAGGQCMFIPLSPAAKWSRSLLGLAMGRPITTAYFASGPLEQWVGEVLATRSIRNRVVFGSAMAPYLLENPGGCRRVLFDMVDVDSDKWRQYASASGGLARWIYAREARALEMLERRAVAGFGKTLLVSHFEAETFRAMAPEHAEQIGSLSNGVDLKYFSPDSSLPNPYVDHENAIVMTGRMDYRPNSAGAIWFVKKVLPFVLDRLPNAHIYLVGAKPPSSLRRLSGSHVTVTGSVKDIRPYIQHAEAVIAPLHLARGVQNKVLEAMAMEKPVVATHEATRALDVANGHHLWIENDPVHFADAVVRAVQRTSHDALTRNARRYVETHHDWDGIFAIFDSHLVQLHEPSASGAGAQADHRIAPAPSRLHPRRATGGTA